MDMDVPDELVEAVRTAPEASEPLLAIASWLKEHGEPVRGEVVELSARRAQLARSDAEHVKVSKTLAKWAKKAKEWTPVAPPGFSSVACDQGLTSRAEADATTLAGKGAPGSLPFLRDLTLTFDEPAGEALHPVGALHLDRLAIEVAKGAIHALEALRTWGGTVRGLAFGGGSLDNRTAGAFKESWEALPQLEALDLGPGDALDNLGLEDLLSGGNVRDLVLRRHGPTMLNLDPYPSVQRIDLGSMDLAGGQWGNVGYSYPNLTSVRHQNLSGGDVSALEVLSEAWSLSSLDLYQPRLGDEAASFLAGPWDHLEALHLRQDVWNAAGWKGFERDWPKLRALQLEIRGAEPAWYRSLHGLAPQLQVLALQADTPFLDDLFAVRWSRLHTLLLGSTHPITTEQVDRLLDRGVFPNLRYLFVHKDYGPDKDGLRSLRKAYGYGLARVKRMDWELAGR